MAKTWLQFKTGVRAILADVTPSDDLFVLAVSEYVKAMLSREVDKDLQLHKSYTDSYQELRKRLVGYSPLTLVLGGTLDVAVRELLTVDGVREGVQAYITRQIKAAHQDLTSMTIKIDRMIRAAVIDLQSHIECYRVGHETVYEETDTVEVDGAFRALLPEQAELSQAILIEPVPALLAGTYYACGSHVSSNGSTYVVVRSGTSADPLGDGLITTDGTIEYSGSAGFSFVAATACINTPALPIPWQGVGSLAYIKNNCCARGKPPVFAIDQETLAFYGWPLLTEDRTFKLIWNGLKLDFLDGEFVPFDETSENAVKEWVLSEMALAIDKDARQSEMHRSRYEMQRSRLFADCSARTQLKPIK